RAPGASIHGDGASGRKNQIARRHPDIDRVVGKRRRFQVNIMIQKLAEDVNPSGSGRISGLRVLSIGAGASGNLVTDVAGVGAAHRLVVGAGEVKRGQGGLRGAGDGIKPYPSEPMTVPAWIVTRWPICEFA